MLDSLAGEELAKCVFAIVKEVRRQNWLKLGPDLKHVMEPFLRAHDELVLQSAIDSNPSLTLERAIRLLHLTPGLLPSADGRSSRRGRFRTFLKGDIGGILSWLLFYTRPPRLPSGEGTVRAQRARTSRPAYERGSFAKAALALVSPAPYPQNDATLSIFRKEHHLGDPYKRRHTRV